MHSVDVPQLTASHLSMEDTKEEVLGVSDELTNQHGLVDSSHVSGEPIITDMQDQHMNGLLDVDQAA